MNIINGKYYCKDGHKRLSIIQDLLKNGKCSAKMILTECMNNGISKRTVNTAKEQLAIKSVKEKNGWYWIMARGEGDNE